ncbi:hypothetical protein D2V17_03330 [Aurantiacibacter xanthus]|uniref:Uncharacterized protein n=1 Tax=Aurantiacibacter xanthus TaxID=1784712 RepID=A0A3A1PCA2_9SPHN|nr:hypothetical protein [Aurantiacibacter xanthus]RIV91183.1 hypothetical protein D2V17_03330 [Aurantiacibacter xanthus]
MNDDAQEGTNTTLDALGLTAHELGNIANATFKFFNRDSIRKALNELLTASADTEARICQSLMSQAFSGGYGETGKYLVAQFTSEMIGSKIQLPQLLERVLAAPHTHRDLAHWWLLMTALDASSRFQMNSCGNCAREETLTGALLECLSGRGEVWAEYLRPAIGRMGAELRFHGIDLQVLGGEQETGGDFGLILDFDGRTVLPNERGPLDPRSRIVPLIFQAKRYTRPEADVSQHNPTRGYQKDRLATNECTSAYVFYEDGPAPISSPLPPLVKLVGNVTGYRTTDTLDQSLDLPSFLLRAATDQAFAAEAASPEDALRMIYSKADPEQLRALVVIASDPDASHRYSSWLSALAPEILHRRGPEEQELRRD